METSEAPDARNVARAGAQHPRARGHGGPHMARHGRVHARMMLICVPMFAVVAVLVATGTVRVSALLFLLPCAVMMAAMPLMASGRRGPGSR